MESRKPTTTHVVQPLEPDVLVVPKDVRGCKTQTCETNVISSQSDTKNSDGRTLAVSANQDANHGTPLAISQGGGMTCIPLSPLYLKLNHSYQLTSG